MTTFFEHQKSSYKKSYLRNLISIASSDGLLDNDEKNLIHRVGKVRGLKEWQVNQLLEEDFTDHEVFIPETVSNRMNQAQILPFCFFLMYLVCLFFLYLLSYGCPLYKGNE